MSNNEAIYPLGDIKVLDFTKLLAGPLCTQYLSDLGAEVIKVEDRQRGDDSRTVPPFHAGNGAWFYGVNRNKRSVALDLKSPEAKDVVARLVEWADVVVESFGGGVAERLGVGRDELMKQKPSLIYCSISAYGRSGPRAHLPGYELMMQAFSGMMDITGEEDGMPVRTAFSPTDQTTGIHAATSILAALRHRDKTGEGRYVEASLYETAMGFMSLHAQSYWLTGDMPKRHGSGMPDLCPYQAFRAADGDMVLAVGNDNLWRKFCAAADLGEYVDDPRFATNTERVKHRAETLELVSRVMASKTLAEWTEILTENSVPFSPIYSLETAFTDEQAHARGVLMEYQHPEFGVMKAVAYPGSIQGLPREIRRPPPVHGEHTREILTQLGFSDQQIDELESGEVLGVKAKQA